MALVRFNLGDLMSVFNKNNQTHLKGKHRLFFGETMGLPDSLDEPYPALEALYQKQMSQIWNEFEVDISKDRIDMRSCPKEIRDLMIISLKYQLTVDTIAARSITSLLQPHITASSGEHVTTAWQLFETIHERTYLHIIRQTVEEPKKLLEEIYEDKNILKRCKPIIDAFDDLQNMNVKAPLKEKRQKLILALTALFALEQIAFMASFSVTFGIAEYTKYYQGIGQLVKLICRDEVLHTRNVGEFIAILKKEDPNLIEDHKAGIKRILDEVVLMEYDFAEYLFSDGRECIGLNTTNIKEYVNWVAAPVYGVFGLTPSFKKGTKNPLPYMDDWIDGSAFQPAPQDIQNSSYLVGSVMDDSDELDLNFDDI